MRSWTVIALALSAVPTAALACSCINSEDPVELRTFARDIAKDAVALVEVETIVPFDQSNGAGDRMRIIRSLAGRAGGEFTVERGPFPSGASCDMLFEKGQRAVVLLYPGTRPARGEPMYLISGLCTGLMLEKPAFRDEAARLINARAKSERG